MDLENRKKNFQEPYFDYRTLFTSSIFDLVIYDVLFSWMNENTITAYITGKICVCTHYYFFTL